MAYVLGDVFSPVFCACSVWTLARTFGQYCANLVNLFTTFHGRIQSLTTNFENKFGKSKTLPVSLSYQLQKFTNLNGQKMKSIDLTPTWQAAAKICILALENGTEEGKKAAREELMNMATLAQLYREDQEKKSYILTGDDAARTMHEEPNVKAALKVIEANGYDFQLHEYTGNPKQLDSLLSGLLDHYCFLSADEYAKLSQSQN